MGYYDPPDPLIFPCPIGDCSNEDCIARDACSAPSYVEHFNGENVCVVCDLSEDDHHDCYDEADKAGVFDPPEPDDERF